MKNLVKEKSYAASTEVLKVLLNYEEMLEDNLHDYVMELKTKLDLTQKLVISIQKLFVYIFMIMFPRAVENFRNEASRMSADFETFRSNPLSSFALIRHQQQDWHKWALFMKEKIGEGSIMIYIYIICELYAFFLCL